MKNNNRIIIRKIAQKNLASNRSRNVFLILAIFMATFMIATVISLCVNQIETQRLYFLQYFGKTDNEIEPIIYVLIMMVILLMLAGFLLIYNVMSVSVSRDIRFYGQLRTIGMSQKQIKRMVLQQILLLCIIGIPLGLFSSAIASLAVVPMFLNMSPQISAVGYSISFHPFIFISAAMLSFLSVIIGSFHPAQKAAQVSPVEALRFSEYSYVRKQVRTSAFSPIKMAWRNVFRVPKRAALVFCSLFLGMTVFLAVNIILGSLNVDMFVKTAAINIRGDIYLRNGIIDQYGYAIGNDIQAFTHEFMNRLNELPGLTEKRVGYVQKIRMDVVNMEGETDNLQGCVYGIGAKRIADLNKELVDPIDETAFLRGEFVIIRDLMKKPSFTADNVVFSFEDIETPVSFELGAVLPSEFLDYYGINYNWLPSIYMSIDLLKEFIAEPEIYEIELDIERNEQKQALSMVNEMTVDQEDIILRSGIAIRQEAENIVYTLTIIGNGISVILWLIGVVNFISIIMASILSRRHELALLESVGQSAGQSKKILMYEGLIYASVTLLFVGILGNVISYGFFLAMEQQLDYIVFTFPFVSFFIMVFVVYAICLSMPRLMYHFVSRETITDRLKEVE